MLHQSLKKLDPGQFIRSGRTRHGLELARQLPIASEAPVVALGGDDQGPVVERADEVCGRTGFSIERRTADDPELYEMQVYRTRIAGVIDIDPVFDGRNLGVAEGGSSFSLI